jgi:hypothetical protein
MMVRMLTRDWLDFLAPTVCTQDFPRGRWAPTFLVPSRFFFF